MESFAFIVEVDEDYFATCLYKNEMPLKYGTRLGHLSEKYPGNRVNGKRVYSYKIVEIFPHIWDPMATYNY